MREEQKYAESYGNNIVGGGWGSGVMGGAAYAAAMAQQQQNTCADRQSAKGQLRVRIQQLRREADRLEALAKALPEELPQSADDALYDLLSRR